MRFIFVFLSIAWAPLRADDGDRTLTACAIELRKLAPTKIVTPENLVVPPLMGQSVARPNDPTRTMGDIPSPSAQPKAPSPITERQEALLEALANHFPQSKVEPISVGGESYIFRVIHPTGSQIIKVPKKPDCRRTEVAYAREAQISRRTRSVNLMGGQHLIHADPLFLKNSNGTTEQALILRDAPEGALADRLTEFNHEADPKKVLDAWRQIALGVKALHSLGYVHRDIKPDNILMEKQDGQTVFILADFGISKDLDEPIPIVELVQGTPHYMSPNQLNGGFPNARDDMRGLQVTFIEMLIGDRITRLNPSDPDNHILRHNLGFGAIPWISKVPENVAQNLPPELRSIAETEYPNVDALLHAIEKELGRRNAREATPESIPTEHKKAG